MHPDRHVQPHTWQRAQGTGEPAVSYLSPSRAPRLPHSRTFKALNA